MEEFIKKQKRQRIKNYFLQSQKQNYLDAGAILCVCVFPVPGPLLKISPQQHFHN